MTKTEDPTPTAILEQPHRERRSPAAQAGSYAGSVFGFFALWLRFAAASLTLVAPSTLGRYRFIPGRSNPDAESRALAEEA
jgi:hypothetical protein